MGCRYNQPLPLTGIETLHVYWRIDPQEASYNQPLPLTGIETMAYCTNGVVLASYNQPLPLTGIETSRTKDG